MELANQNLQKAKDEAAGMEGNNLSTVYFDSSYLFVLLSDPSVHVVEKMRLALAKKDLDLAAAQKEAQEKTALADKKLASVGALEEEITKLKSSLTESNREATRLKKDKVTLNEHLESMSRRRNDLEAYLKALAKKLFLMLEGTPFLSDCFTIYKSLRISRFINSLNLQNSAKTLKRKLDGSRRSWIPSFLQSAMRLP